MSKHKNRARYGSKDLPPCFHPPIETSPSSPSKDQGWPFSWPRLIFHRNETVSTIVRKAFLLSAILRPFSSSLIARRVGERASRRCTRAASNWKLARGAPCFKGLLVINCLDWRRYYLGLVSVISGKRLVKITRECACGYAHDVSLSRYTCGGLMKIATCFFFSSRIRV